MGEAGKEIEFVKVNIFYEGKNYILHSLCMEQGQTKHIRSHIVLPPILRSNTKYDFKLLHTDYRHRPKKIY